MCVAPVAQCAAEAEQTDLQWLSAHEAHRVAHISAPLRRSQFLAGHWLARQALSAFAGAAAPQLWALAANAAGAPTVLGHPHLHLSLSHSADWVVCAVSDAPIGVDIEAPARARDWARLAPTVFSTAELKSAEGLDAADALQYFYRVWTLKEAWFKSRGEGLALERLAALHTQAMPIGQGNARVWQAEGVTLALIASADAQVVGEGWMATAPSWWQVGAV
ncbi:4'-phosphopantetheinyl transferase superfamily protein [Rhodoferax sp. OV413]|uniref:4'-phosphopantetheinyl transferase family protein n=1 Tax=Rhodoferax sp. OV413 TaxID=1855285 RepID=UPI0015A0AF50|nr:4'-phosphopantetheinyl transferase superfamily protein [Rhodoferax sp. OV413]